MTTDPSTFERFSWRATAQRLESVLGRHELLPDSTGKQLVRLDEAGVALCRFIPPLVQPIPSAARSASDYLQSLTDRLGRHLIVLIQAGAAALGLWQDGEMVHHKVIRKYMVRGHGKFQGTHLKTKGKSRYGSRLRLRNTLEFFVAINTKLREWEAEVPAFDTIFYSCPVRLWPELFGAKVPPPFDWDDPLVKIPLDVHVPSFKELRHVYFELTHGTIVESR